MWPFNLEHHLKDFHNSVFPIYTVKEKNEVSKAKPFSDDRESELMQKKFPGKDVF